MWDDNFYCRAPRCIDNLDQQDRPEFFSSSAKYTQRRRGDFPPLDPWIRGITRIQVCSATHEAEVVSLDMKARLLEGLELRWVEIELKECVSVVQMDRTSVS